MICLQTLPFSSNQGVEWAFFKEGIFIVTDSRCEPLVAMAKTQSRSRYAYQQYHVQFGAYQQYHVQF